MIGRYSKAFKLALKRTSGPSAKVKVIRESGGTENIYGKDDGTWDNPEHVGSWVGAMSYGFRSDRPKQEYTGSGERDQDTPVFLLPAEAEIQNGDRLIFRGQEFEIMSDPVIYPTHYEVRTTKVETNGQN